MKKILLCALALFMFTASVFASAETVTNESVGDNMTKLLYQGHGSYRITSKDGVVIYVDPYAGTGYDVPADIILVTHEHGDHNQIQLPARKDSCVVIRAADALVNGEYKTFNIDGLNIEAVEAYNKNHNRNSCVGFIITIDGIPIYAAGDTSTTEQMASFAERHFSYALLPCDGIYNMGLDEAAACAELIGAKHNIPIHMKPGALFDLARAEAFNAPNRLIVQPGEEITLEP